MTISSLDALPLLPWQRPAGWQPPYAGLQNNLSRLLEVQRPPGSTWVTVFALSHLDTHNALMLANALTTLHYFGGAGGSYIVALADDEGLAHCMRLGLPCFNASREVAPENRGAHGGYGTEGYYLGCWVKVLVVRRVLQLLPPGVNVLLSDHDVVFLKRLAPSVDAFLSGTEWDVTGMVEDYGHKGMNTGVLFIRNSPNSRAMYDAWAAAATRRTGDQEIFYELYGVHWLACMGPTAADCKPDPAAGPGKVPTAQAARVARHNSPWEKNINCPPVDRHKYDDAYRHEGVIDNPAHCAVPGRLYAHLICLSDKQHGAEVLGLWFLDRVEPLGPRLNVSAMRAAGLPCAPPADVAELSLIK
ncbi:hypothetical protein HXX76_000973 [Chlamydomonas incerta]|uniref:Nucleotide-diphospho-sugar transferase domain-containing protein n=1 Tax=Chlamydomonas incerta TaxID=51695 RepID=A0A835WFH0_CHLIN|nr:hypothetical protein HXX76_000973 [Chlamydomonas incerta]|eukprot:KAG2446388.1 hypothetical protein HXX76_000973 [Chlamydomonas incerta]